MVTGSDIRLGDNATIHYLKSDEYIIYADEYIIYAEDYQDYKNQGAALVEFTGLIVGAHSPDGKNSNGDLIKINKVFLMSDEEISFFTFFDKDTIEEYNYRLSAYSTTMSWLGKVEDYSGKYGSWVHISRIQSVSSIKVDPQNDGCSCKTCKTFIQYAAPNQPDGTLLCFSCRGNPVRAYY